MDKEKLNYCNLQTLGVLCINDTVARQKDRCTVQKTNPKDFVLLYYSIIKDQCTTNKTYVLTSALLKIQTRTQYIRIWWR